jgi:hypothetical protein
MRAAHGYSTATDLLKFAEALRKHRLLDAAPHTRVLTTGRVPCFWGNYGYGFVDNVEGAFAGSVMPAAIPAPTARCRFWDSGYTVVVLSNMDPPTATRLATFAGIRLPAQ